MTTTVFLGLLAVALAAALPSQVPGERKYQLDGHIVGGSATTIQKYPFAVTLWRTDIEDIPEWNFCGGSIISSNWVLTAGHCTHGRTASALFIRAGNTNKNQGTKSQVSELITHPKFFEHKDGSADYDAGLLKLKTAITFSTSAKAVNLATASQAVSAGTQVTVVGWGSTHEEGSTVDVLREVSIPVVSVQQCTKDYGKDINSDTMICAGLTQGGKDSCQGDSGGPLVSESTQVGIVSWGGGCAEANQPGVYAKIAYFRDWIKTQTGV